MRPESFLVPLSVLLYLGYVVSGLVLGISPYLVSQHDSLTMMLYGAIRAIPALCWFDSIRCLALAHLFHSMVSCGIFRGLVFFVYSAGVIFVLEELGLATGWPFGPYHFTPSLGNRITNALPTNVLVLWACLLYPSFQLGRRISFGISTRFQFDVRSKHRALGCLLTVVLSVLILTGFDVVSEPVAVLYGHKLWDYCATVKADANSFLPKPDWLFDEFSSSMKEFYPYNVPLQNFLGWVLAGTLIYLPAVLLLPSPERSPSDPVSKLSLPEVPLLHNIFAWLPFLITNICTQIFYMIHICHPTPVRRLAASYIAVLIASLVWFPYRN